MVKESLFNHICKNAMSESYLLYNFMTGALLELDESSKRKFENHDKLTDAEIELLLNNGFLIDDFDEISYLRFGNKLVCADAELLSILIAPTMECNFDCPYCFEHHGKGKMSIEVQNEIIDFIENSIKRNNHKHLFVYWFGGEPLIGIDIIINMSKRILKIVDQYNLTYSSAMSTNGYYLTLDNVRALNECKLSRIQVTLDGMKEENDKTRRLVGGEGTFDVIVSNLYQLDTHMEVHIRTNLNKNNVAEFERLNQLVNDIREKTKVNITLYGAHMSVYDFNNENVESIELNMREYSELLKKNNMIGTNYKSNCRFAFCDAAKYYSFCFDEKGNLYKCWNDIGNEKFSYDTVFSANKSALAFTNNNALNYLGASFPEECIKCKVLPICFGGCIKKRVVEKRKMCSPVKFNLDDYINKRYQMMKGGGMNESGN